MSSSAGVRFVGLGAFEPQAADAQDAFLAIELEVGAARRACRGRAAASRSSRTGAWARARRSRRGSGSQRCARRGRAPTSGCRTAPATPVDARGCRWARPAARAWSSLAWRQPSTSSWTISSSATRLLSASATRSAGLQSEVVGHLVARWRRRVRRVRACRRWREASSCPGSELSSPAAARAR